MPSIKRSPLACWNMQEGKKSFAEGRKRRGYYRPSSFFFASGKTPLMQAKEAFDIPRLWDVLGLSGKPARSCKSPFRVDRHASFSVAPDGKTWHDFATGEKGDIVAFLAKATGNDMHTAAKELIRMHRGDATHAPQCAINRPPKRLAEQDRQQMPVMPADLHKGKLCELHALSELRGLSLGGLILASEAGLLRFGTIKGIASWLILSECGGNTQARRLDGKSWAWGGKAYTLPHSKASIPIGLARAKDCPFVALMEGSPDLLAGFCLCYAEGRKDVACVAMLGACQRIHPDHLNGFRGKVVRIFAHADEAGMNAARKWTAQIRQAGAKAVEAFSFPANWTTSEGRPVKDLNDFLHLDVDIWEDKLNKDILPTNKEEF